MFRELVAWTLSRRVGGFGYYLLTKTRVIHHIAPILWRWQMIGLLRVSSMFLVGFLAAFGPMGAWAGASREERAVPVKVVACYHTRGIGSWTYEESGNTLNGVFDKRAYLRIQFDRGTLEGSDRIHQGNAIQRLPGSLTWDQDRREVLYVGDEDARVPPVRCAIRGFLGARKMTRNCDLRGAVRASTDDERLAACTDIDKTVSPEASVFEGEIVVGVEP